MAKSNYRGSYGVRKRFRGCRVLPNGHPRASNGSAKIPGKTIKGPYGFCKPCGTLPGVKFEVDGGGYRTKDGVGKKGPASGRWVAMPRNCVRYIEPRSHA